MIKAVLIYVIAFAVLFFLIYFFQEYLLNQLDATVRFSVWDTNIFLAITSLLICIHFQLFSLIKNLETQLGFIYLPTLFIKGILFYLAFKDSVFNIEILNTTERLSLLIPILLFLGLEVFFVVKIISKMGFKY
ncbi:DUF6168 family protein [Winogradskyella ludwigii]|uniref:DUF6168 family protein n=1 Tax=Winogradskyella ludwigii TaxID=2686076 RepID=UPI0037420EC6